MLEGHLVAVGAVSDEARGYAAGADRLPPPLLPLVDVGEVDLDDRDRERLERIVDRPRIVRPRGGVDDDRGDGVVRVVAPLDELALVVRLAALDGELERPRPLVDAALELRDRQAPVELRVTAAQDVQIDSVEHQDSHAINLSSSRRTSDSGRTTPCSGPFAPRRTRRTSPPRVFLSRSIALQARWRS